MAKPIMEAEPEVSEDKLVITRLSGAIELLQHFLLVGMMQTDDVICNTLGTAVGACAYPLSLLWQKLMRKNDKA